MQESYREGIASRTGPEPCEGSREAALVALDRGICRLGIELRKRKSRMPMVSDRQKATRQCTKNASARPILRSRRPHACRETPCARTERPCHCPSAAGQRAGRGTRKGKLFMHGGRESSSCIVPTNDPNKLRTLRAEGGEGRRLAKEIRRQGPDLDTAPEEPGALHCQRNGPTRMVGDVIIQGGNRVR